jgi:hypothetical protein
MAKNEHVAVRLDEDTRIRLDRLIAKMGERAAEFGVLLSLSDVMRAAVTRGLPILEREHGLTPGPAVKVPGIGRRGRLPKPKPKK